MRCPVLIVHGDEDAIVPYATGVALRGWTGGRARDAAQQGPRADPCATRWPNLLVRDFAERGLRRGDGGAGGAARLDRGRDRRRRALFVCSPIGLGHARRDLAIAAELRALHPTWRSTGCPGSGDPGAARARRAGAPGVRALASETAHIEAEAGEHDLHVFQALRRMDEILVANFMVFHDLVREEQYDLWVADEGWDIDHFLHENPELKRTAVRLADRLRRLAADADGGAAEAALTADYNAEMVEHIARYPRLRDRSVFVGDPGDLVPGPARSRAADCADWTQRALRVRRAMSPACRTPRRPGGAARRAGLPAR